VLIGKLVEGPEMFAIFFSFIERRDEVNKEIYKDENLFYV